MLILSRKAGESLILDGGIEIKITEIYGDKVRIGIEAPGSVRVYRKELYATIKENESAAVHAPAAAVKDFLKLMKQPEDPVVTLEAGRPEAPPPPPAEGKPC